MEASRLNMRPPGGKFLKRLPARDQLPSLERYLNLAVSDMFGSMRMLQNIREKYDAVVRNYEEETEWNSDPCIYQRVSLVEMAANVLSMSFLSFEQREAKSAEEAKNWQKHVGKMLKGFVIQMEREEANDKQKDLLDSDEDAE